MSKRFDTLKQARAWAYRQSFKEIMFLIYDREEHQYQLINEERYNFLQGTLDLDMQVIETWE